MKNLTFIKKFRIPEAAYRSIGAMFTEEEIEFVVKMEQETFTEKDIEALGIQGGKRFIETSYRRGIISVADEEKGTYRISDFYNRLDIFSISETEAYKSLPEEERRALDGWYFQAYYESLDPSPELPPTADEILPLEDTLTFIEAQNRPVYLNYCDCRSLRGDCGMPTKTCITYKNGINSFAHRGLSEQIDKETAKEIVRMADKAGLVHTVNPNGICNCCGDCCYLFRGQRKRDSAGIWPKSTYIISFDEAKCIGCGKCIRRCSFGVFHHKEESSNQVHRFQDTDHKDKPVITAATEGCIGCGVCVQSCPVGALTLKGR